MTTNAPPSSNPANLGSLSGMMQVVLEKFARQFDVMIPAEVISFDRVTNRAVVQPLIMVVDTENNTTNRAQIVDVPVFQPSGGGYVINFPLKPGDIGRLHAADRDVSLFNQSYKQARPNTKRLHSFEDATFYPDVMRGWTVEDDGLVIQTLSGNQKINIQENHIRIFSDTEIIFDAPMTTITGQLRSGTNGGGLATFGGDVRVQNDVISTSTNVTLNTHHHTGVQPGGGQTGDPVAG